jgi:glycine cleavage system H protein
LYAPVSGIITAVNSTLAERPESVNSDPHGSWMIAIKADVTAGDPELLDAAQYTELTK